MAGKRRVGLGFLTMGGRRFVEITPERFERLYESEQQNIIKMAEYTPEDIRKIDRQSWKEMTANSLDKGAKELARYWAIARGTAVAEVEDIVIGNYTKGLRIANRDDLADRFNRLARALKDNDRSSFSVLMETEMPDLYLYYKDKGRSHTKRQSTYNQETANEQISEIETILDNWENDPLVQQAINKYESGRKE